jgi:NAD(P)-dependent dehydrogenase (short-subunit alcohol dehydrogenase family)
MSLRGLNEKVAAVTGAAGGIGAATVQRLLEEGCRVVAVDSNAELLDKFVASVKSDRLVPAACDISTEDGCAAFVETGIRSFGAFHLLVNNAGIRGPIAPIAEMPVADFDRVIAVNVRGVFLGMQAALRQILKQGSGGAIVNISSLNAFRANPERAHYNSSKHAVIGLTATAAIEYGPHNIRVNAVCPGPVATAMSKLADESRAKAGWRMDYTLRPIARKAEPSEVAGFICWLLSDEASFQTGGVYTVDGGATA